VSRRMAVKRRHEITAPASREVRDAYQSQFVHKVIPPQVPVEKGVERAVESHAGRSIHPPRTERWAVARNFDEAHARAIANNARAEERSSFH